MNPQPSPSPLPSVSLPLPQHVPAGKSAVLARIRALHQRPARDAQNAFFLEGLRSFIQAHDAGFHFQAVVHSPILLKGDLGDMLARRLHLSGTPRLKLSPEVFRSVSAAARASGIGAIVRQRWSPLDEPRPGLCHLIVEHIRSPGNLGTILRTAEAAGVASVIFVGHLSDPYHPAAVRASMGGLFHLPLVRTTHEALAAWSRRHRVRLVALSPDAERLWTDLPRAALHSPLALVLGEERKGLSPYLRSLCGTSVKLPMTGRADSLNVSIAAAVMLYELVRRSTAA
jgi:TrmH family RNA methyltransferase